VLGDIRLYLVQLESALEGKLTRGERRLARREVKNVAESLAFHSARVAQRFAPEREDWQRALDALKSPAEAARVLARRRPFYRRRAMVNAIRGWAIVVVLVVAGLAFAQFVTSEKATTLVSVNHVQGNVTDGTVVDRNFTVQPGLLRLDVTVETTGINPGGVVEVTLLDPHGADVWSQDFGRDTRGFDETNLHPTVGTWRLLVDYRAASGFTSVIVSGVQPSR
jgi:hypothetical protein